MMKDIRVRYRMVHVVLKGENPEEVNDRPKE